MLDHAVRIGPQAGLAGRFLLQMCEDVHAGGVPPDEERLVRFLGAFHEVQRLGVDLFIDGFHTLLRQRTGVHDPPIREAVNDAARPEPFLEVRILGLLRIIRMLRLLLRVQVIEVAEELIEPVVRRQHLITVPEVVLAELPGHVALRPEERGDGRIFLFHALGRARQADLGKTRADG